MEHYYLAFFWILYFVVHSILASDPSKDFIKNKIAYIFPFYRITYNLIALFTLFFVLKYQNSISSDTIFQEILAIQFIGYAITFKGVALGILAFKNYSGMEFIGLDFSRKPRSNILNTSGLNKYVRHPLYFSALLIVWGYFLTNSAVTNLIMNCVITAYLIIGTRLEERKMIQEFGEEYKQYIKQVPMLLPIKIFGVEKN